MLLRDMETRTMAGGRVLVGRGLGVCPQRCSVAPAEGKWIFTWWHLCMWPGHSGCRGPFLGTPGGRLCCGQPEAWPISWLSLDVVFVTSAHVPLTGTQPLGGFDPGDNLAVWGKQLPGTHTAGGRPWCAALGSRRTSTNARGNVPVPTPG